MKLPNFTAFQFIDAPTLNGGIGAVSGSLSAMASSSTYPGLVRPDAVSYAASGLIMNVTAPLPFRVLFGSGILAEAHGVTTGQDTQTAAVNFTGSVPGSGSVTAYLLASYVPIQQGAYQVVGPPPGHPDFNPNFAPVTAYQLNVDSLQFSASTTPPDNVTTFELGRFTLSAGATGLATINTNFQQQAQDPSNTVSVPVSGNITIPVTNSGRLMLVTAASTLTMPPVSGANGLLFGFSSNTSGTVTIQTQGADLLFGGLASAVSGVASINLPQEATVYFLGTQGSWQTVFGSSRGLGNPAFQVFAGNPNGNVAGTAGVAGSVAPDMVWDSTYFVLWVCTTSGNAASAVWTASGLSCGDAKPTLKTTPDPGYIMANDGTIGNASSGGTTRANADTLPLFTLVWNGTVQGDCPVSGGRGASAAADFAANKTITIPKALGRALASAGSGAGLTARNLGSSTGTETVTIAQANLPSFNLPVSDPTHAHNQTGENPGGYTGSSSFVPAGTPSNTTTGTTQAAATGISVGTGGSGTPINNMQPSFFLNFMIHL